MMHLASIPCRSEKASALPLLGLRQLNGHCKHMASHGVYLKASRKCYPCMLQSIADLNHPVPELQLQFFNLSWRLHSAHLPMREDCDEFTPGTKLSGYWQPDEVR